MTRSIISYHQGGRDDDLMRTIRAELLHTDFLVQHNIPFLTADHSTFHYAAKCSLILRLPKNFRCSRTKTTAILNEAMKLAIKAELLNYMLK